MKNIYIFPLASSLILVLSLAISALPYFHGNHFVLVELAISTLQSPTANPEGYLIASGGPLLSVLLIFPMIPKLFQQFRIDAHIKAIAGVFSLIVALTSTCINAVLSLLSYSGRFHADLATATFFSSIVAILFLLHASILSRGRFGFYLYALLFLSYFSIFALTIIWIGPDYFEWPNPLDKFGINTWHIIGIAELLLTALIYTSLVLLGFIVDDNANKPIKSSADT